MKRNDKQIEAALEDAVRELVPDLADDIWDREESSSADAFAPAEAAGLTVRKGGKGRIVSIVLIAAACLALMLVPRIDLNRRVESTVYIDVNPSLELQLDQSDRVLRVRADNADGERILADMDLQG